ncbi:post-GPI attachment to proteins factor 3-like [Penaeus chinensis]|uniref:post-GPI attachment to proteins factor 3-like n=1 Tax=Penaeus chinensis TaxID=139456 RepID=UPI001FB83E0D|nr:post-GPI attachment to proteins factor 3-like [Penaeus chinensis]
MWKLLILHSLMIYSVSEASRGDTSNEYTGCYHVCHFNTCSSSRGRAQYESTQSLSERVLQWTCDDECKYNCMWHTTEIFVSKGLEIPQFFGKWPFVRVWGMQEPAAVLFSIFNLFAHIISLHKFRQAVPSIAPLYKFWHVHALICINAWLWSVVFHARDTPWTERMDYFSAFSMVLFSLFGLLVRLSGPHHWKRKEILGLVCILFFTYHVWYLTRGRFDYGYNMKVNILVGILNGCGWIAWGVPRSNRPHVRWCILTVIGAVASMLLELGDFPPFFWAVDAHALWHLATAPLPFMWYKFLEGDCNFLLRGKAFDYRKQI